MMPNCVNCKFFILQDDKCSRNLSYKNCDKFEERKIIISVEKGSESLVIYEDGWKKHTRPATKEELIRDGILIPKGGE